MLLKLFKKTKKISTGIDISSGGFSVMSLSKENNSINLENFAYNYFEQNVFLDNMIVKPQIFAEIIKKTLDENNFNIKSVNVGIPSNIVFSKILKLPVLPHNELKIIVKQEASKHFPLKIDEMVVDFDILENTRKDNKVDTIVCALPKKYEINFIESFNLAGLKVDSIDLGSFAMIRTLANADMINNPDLVYVSVLIGYENTDIHIIKNGMPIYSHNIELGKRTILESIMRELQLLWNETEKRLQSLGIIMSGTEPLTDPDSNKASNVAKKIFSDIAIEIEKAIDFYISQNDETSAPELIIFGGSGVCIGNIDKYISNKLKIKTVLCESLNNVYYPREFIENRETPLNIQALTTIMGLALKGFTN